MCMQQNCIIAKHHCGQQIGHHASNVVVNLNMTKASTCAFRRQLQHHVRVHRSLLGAPNSTDLLPPSSTTSMGVLVNLGEQGRAQSMQGSQLLQQAKQ